MLTKHNSGDKRAKNLHKFLEQVDVPEMLRNFGQVTCPLLARKTGASCPITCQNKALFFSSNKICASF